MNQSFEILGYHAILEQLSELANTERGKQQALELKPYLEESKLRKNLRDTTQARQMLTLAGTAPIPAMEKVEDSVDGAVRGELISPEALEEIGYFLAAVRRLKDYLGRGRQYGIGLAFYDENLVCLEELEQELERSIRSGRVCDYASNELRDIRREIENLEDKLKNKAEVMMRAQKSAMAENFVVSRNGRLCLPVKKDCRSKVRGTVVDRSASGATLFIEPEGVAALREELELLRIGEDNEERRILYQLADMIARQEAVFKSDIEMIVKLDFIFAKGRLSEKLEAVQPEINTERRIRIVKGRHPMLRKEECVPLDFSIEPPAKGVVVTGPNTGGKTVSIKTVGLLSLMACSGLHIPCGEADICMNSQVLCDIGDGQNISDNLSTFSAHISNVIDILKLVNQESLVLLDELGSGTDPTEGMGIAIAILEELRLSGCLFLATTHYAEVKVYAEQHDEIINARMAFDRENLKPLYRLEVGKTGESCALYIAKRLGLPDNMIAMAAGEAYGASGERFVKDLMNGHTPSGPLKKEHSPRIKKQPVRNTETGKSGMMGAGGGFTRGDSVLIYPEETIGIVVKPADELGNVLVQVRREKIWMNWKRLKLKVKAAELYPEDYDFSIIFDTVENRKARHQMSKKYVAGMEVREE